MDEKPIEKIMKIRKVRAFDEEQLIRLVSDFWKIHIRQKTLNRLIPFAAYKDIDKETRMAAIMYINNKEYITYIAEQNGIIIGYISGKIKIHRNKVLNKAGYIDNWYVIEKHRNNGIGKKLWEKLVGDFKRRDCTHLLLDTWSENLNAKSIYTKMGFIEEQINMVKKI